MKTTMLPQPPGKSRDVEYEPPSFIDYLLRPAVTLSYIIMDFSIVRLGIAIVLFPTYLTLAFLRSFLLPALPYLYLLASWRGRTELAQRGKANRRAREKQAQTQLDGTFSFPPHKVEKAAASAEISGRISKAWAVPRKFVTVCPGVDAAVVRAGDPNGTKLVLLHGNPSWSFMYRHVIPVLAARGFDIYAVDWIGLGMSDKPLAMEDISIELQSRVLVRVFEEFRLRDAHILAHDWGGCVALCTIPILEPGACRSIMLLNSFFPPRPFEISLNCRLLYLVWLSSQGIFDGLLPESLIIRYMAPGATSAVTSGYSAPFSGYWSKKGVSRFAATVPGMPAIIYRLFQSQLGLIIDGLCPKESFSSLHAQVRLRETDHTIRKFWSDGKADIKVAVVFGRRDPLLRDYYDIFLKTIRTSNGAPEGVWIDGAGHYPVEEESGKVAEFCAEFIRTGHLPVKT